MKDFNEFRRAVAASERPELTMEEINEEIRLAREEMVYLKNTEWLTSKTWNKKPQKHRIACRDKT